MHDVSEGIRVLASRDGVVLSESQILERARNIVMGLIGNYRIETLDRDHHHAGASDGRHAAHDERDATLESIGAGAAEATAL